MKQFNLEEYLANPNRKVVTRDGKSVRIICTDRLSEEYPVVALWHYVNEKGKTLEEIETFTRCGQVVIDSQDSCDLFFAPEKKEGWVNVYKNEYGAYVLGEIFIGKEHKEVTTGLTYIALAKIEWEE